jgi:hypothetical protein
MVGNGMTVPLQSPKEFGAGMMINLSSMTYDEFGKLRFLDFFPKTDSYYVDDVGGTTCGIGYACVDGYGFTGFASPENAQGQTSEIALDFRQDCPVIEGQAFLRFLGLELLKGMPLDEIKILLGEPEKSDPSMLRYIIGEKWPYYLGLGIDEHEGLHTVWICRKDLADKETLKLKQI